MPTRCRGFVRAVPSGDCLTIQSVSKENPWEEQVYLAFISAPRCGNHAKAEDAFAFEAREVLRDALIGKKIDFVVEYQVQGRKYVSICQDECPVTFNFLLVQQGLAKAMNTRSTSKIYEDIKWIADDSAERKVGVWSEDASHIEKHLRKVTYHGDMEYSAVKILEAANSAQAPLTAILEHVFSSSYVTLYLFSLKTVIKMQLVHLYSPNAKEEPELAEQAKSFVQKMLLHRTVAVKLSKVDDRNELVGRIIYP